MAQVRVGDTLSRTFGTVFGNFGTFLRTQGVVVLALSVVSLVLTLAVFVPSMGVLMEAVSRDDPAGALVALAPLFTVGALFALVSVVGQTFAAGIGIVTADALLRGERITLAQAFAESKGRFWSILLSILLMGLAFMGIMLGGAILFILIVPIFAAFVFVLYLLARWAVLIPVAVLETRPVTANFKRASELTAGSRGAIFGAAVLLLLAIIVPVAIISVPIAVSSVPDVGPDATPEEIRAAFEETQGAIGAQILRWVVNTVAQLIGGFLISAFTVVLYRRLVEAKTPPAEPDAGLGPIGSVPMP